MLKTTLDKVNYKNKQWKTDLVTGFNTVIWCREISEETASDFLEVIEKIYIFPIKVTL